MDKKKLSEEIENIINYFEPKPWTDNVKLLKQEFDINSINTPKHYLKMIDEISEVLRETRILYLYATLNKVCKEEGKLYYFDTPFQSGMKYNAVLKKEEVFYLIDEEGDHRELFTSDKFTQFIDDQYWELYE